jgi:hypothetical protein
MRLEQYPSHILLHSARDCALWEMQNLSRGAAVAIYAIAFSHSKRADFEWPGLAFPRTAITDALLTPGRSS